MMQVIIKEMQEQDIPFIVRIERMSFSTPWSEYSFLTEITKPNAIAKLAVLDNIIIGYICIEQVLDEAHILNLAVHPEYRNMGIAIMLVSHIMEELRLKKCRFIYLEVRASNHIAQMLYKSFGFRVTGTRKKYYILPDEDAVIMEFEM